MNKFAHLKLICQVLHVDVCMFVKLPKNQVSLNLRQYEFQAEKSLNLKWHPDELTQLGVPHINP